MILALFDPPSDFEARVREVAPAMQVNRSAPGEGSFDAAVADARIIVGRPEPEHLERAKFLEWVQLSSAGADRYAGRLSKEVILTSANGVYGVPTSEHALAMMLAMTRRLPDLVRAQGRREWERALEFDELYGRTLGILGMGDIGSALARRAKAFGMRVLGLRRTKGDLPDFVDAMFGADGLHELLGASDHVVNVLPGTEATSHLIDSAALQSMKPTAFLYNLGRGSTFDEAALVEALRSGTIAGAGLDVFDEEPLPASSPIWAMDRVLISPHRGGYSPHEDARVADLFLKNLRRRIEGEPMLNVVDRELGY